MADDDAQFQIAELRAEADALREWAAVAMLEREDRGWELLTGKPLDVEGPQLDEVKEVSHQLRLLVTANPLMDHAVSLRTSYIWSKPPIIPGAELKEGTPGRKPRLPKFISNPLNQKALFSTDAHEVMESSVATDACYLLLGNRTSKELRPIPIEQIVEVLVHEDFNDDIRAYKRKWVSYKDGQPKEMARWYYVDSVPASEREKTIGNPGSEVEVDDKYDMLDFWANRQVGWAFGIADGVSAAPHAREYVHQFNQGNKITSALARYVGTITNKTAAGQARAGLKMSEKGGAGKLAGLADGNRMEIFASAGKTYNYDGLRPLAALVAAAMDVSVLHLLSDPGSAGGSYGAASNLDLPTKRAIVQRQKSWVVFLKRVIKWGTNEDVDVHFPPLDEPDPYREMQTIVLAVDHGFIHRTEARSKVSDITGIELTEDDVPDEFPGGTGSAGVQAASPDQGVSNGTGGTDSAVANDLQDQTIA